MSKKTDDVGEVSARSHNEDKIAFLALNRVLEKHFAHDLRAARDEIRKEIEAEHARQDASAGV